MNLPVLIPFQARRRKTRVPTRSLAFAGVGNAQSLRPSGYGGALGGLQREPRLLRATISSNSQITRVSKLANGPKVRPIEPFGLARSRSAPGNFAERGPSDAFPARTQKMSCVGVTFEGFIPRYMHCRESREMRLSLRKSVNLFVYPAFRKLVWQFWKLTNRTDFFDPLLHLWLARMRADLLVWFLK